MTIRALKAAAALAVAALVSTSGSASAQTTTMPTYELSAGYQLLHAPDQTFPFGVAIDAARNFGVWSIVGQLGWAYDSSIDEVSDDASLSLWDYSGGIRWTGRNHPTVWPFAQVLAGGVSMRASAFDESNTSSHFQIQPGVGVNFVAGDGWGVVGQVDYRRVFLDEDEFGESGQNQFRVFVGLRMILD